MKPQSMLSWLEPKTMSESSGASFGPVLSTSGRVVHGAATSLQPPWTHLHSSVATPLDGSMVGFEAGAASTAATEEPLQHPWLQAAMASPAWRSAISDGRSQPSRGQPSRIQSPGDGSMVGVEAGTASSSTSAYMPPPRARIPQATPEQRARSRQNTIINASRHEFYKHVHDQIERQQFRDMWAVSTHETMGMGWMNKKYFAMWVMAAYPGISELEANCIWMAVASNMKGKHPARWWWVKPNSHEHLVKGYSTGVWIHLYMK